jgi:hypothetical protein
VKIRSRKWFTRLVWKVFGKQINEFAHSLLSRMYEVRHIGSHTLHEWSHVAAHSLKRPGHSNETEPTK